MLRLFFIFCCLSTNIFAQKKDNFSLHPHRINQQSITFKSENAPTGQVGIYYGESPALELGQAPMYKAAHTLTLPNLQPATFYYVQPFVWTGVDTIWGAVGYYSTQSQSTGAIQVYFNQGVDTSYSTGSHPDILSGGSNIEQAIINKINQAQTTIDAAVFNTTRTGIVNALAAAHNRGVQVRFLANSGSLTSNAALRNNPPPFPVAYVNSSYLMHNKFMLIDAQSTNNAWVWTGSCNWTYTDMYTNYNNVIVVQDQALAQAYTLEFNEMWGGTGATFNASMSKVGAAKTNNTPHFFNIGGRMVELYFSPSDNVTSEITSTMYSANNDLEFCILSFTRNEIGTAVRNRHQAGVLEHGIMENINDNGSEFNYLTGLGVNLLADNQATALHHKYVIVDAGDSNSDPQVLTGSHNWTTAAELNNDENTLIIHDATITNLYLQEFALRWCQVKNNVACNLPFANHMSTTTAVPVTELVQVYPNPANDEVRVVLEQAKHDEVEVSIYTLTGQLVQHQQITRQEAIASLQVGQLSNGCYVVQVQDGDKVYQKKLLILH